MLDVVVLPCVPVTAIVGRSRVSSPSSVGAVQLAARPVRALGVVGGDRARDDDLGAGGDVGRVVADGRLDPGGAQRAAVGRAGGAVGARDARAERVRDEREAAHPGAADPHEVQLAACPGIAHAPGSLAAVSRPARKRAESGAVAADRIDRVAREAFGFDALRPGQREGIEAVLDGPRHARRHVDRVGQVGDLPDRGAAARRARRSSSRRCWRSSASRSSELRARAAGGAAAISSDRRRPPSGPRRSPSWPRTRSSSSSSRPSSSPTPDVLDELAIAAAVAAGRRRGALHLRVGPRLPARLPAARRGGRGARAADRARAHRDGGAAGPRRDRRAARPARRARARPAGSTGRRSGSRRAPPATRTASCGRCASTSRPPSRPGIVYVATRRGAEELAAALRERRPARGRLPRAGCARARSRGRAGRASWTTTST